MTDEIIFKINKMLEEIKFIRLEEKVVRLNSSKN